MSSIRRASSPIARRTAPIRRASAATVPAPVLSFTPVSELDELRQLTAVVGVQSIRPIVPAGGIGKDRPVFAAKKTVDRQTRGFAFDVPQGDIDPGNRRHRLRAFTPRDRRRQAVPTSMPPGRGEVSANSFSHTATFANASISQTIAPKRLTHSQIRGIGAPWISP